MMLSSKCYFQFKPFRYVIDEYAIARRAVLVRLFIEALTEGGPGGNPKPIEMHAHDPKRYIGDMFAWLHGYIPSEKDNLIMLFKQCDKNGKHPCIIFNIAGNIQFQCFVRRYF